MTKKELATELVNKWHPDWYDYCKEDKIKKMVRDLQKSTLQMWYDELKAKEAKQ